MLKREDILDHFKYIKAKRKYGLTIGCFYIIGDTVVAHSVETGLRVIFNEKLDIIGVYTGPKDFSYTTAAEYGKEIKSKKGNNEPAEEDEGLIGKIMKLFGK